MKRKLVKQGIATLMISLPSKWVKENKLDKGDEVDIEEGSHELIIRLDPREKPRDTTITITTNVESHIRTLITNTYRSGYDKIHVTFKTKEQFKILEEIIRNKLIGFEITKKETNACTVENITEPSADQFDTILKKLFMNITSMIETTKYNLGDTAREEEIEDSNDVEERIIKYDNFCRRIIKRATITKHPEYLWSFLTLINHAQRELYHLNKILDKKSSKEAQHLAQNLHEMWKDIETSYEKKDVKILEHIHALEKEAIYKRGYAALNKASGKEAIYIYHLLAGLRNLYQANSPLFGMLIAN